MDHTSFRAKVISAFIWISTGTFFIQIISWVSTIFVIRLLTPSDYGLMAMVVPILSFIQMLSSWGFGSAIIQDPELNDNKISQIFGFVILVFGGAFILINMTAPFISSFFNEAEVVPLLRLLSINFLLMSLYIIPDSLMFREMNFRTKTKIDIWSRLGAAIVAPACAMNSLGYWSLAIAEICIHIIRLFYFNLSYHKRYKPSFRFTDCKDLIKFGIIVTGGNIFNYIFYQADKIIIGRFLGKNPLGFYSVAFNLAILPKEKIMPIITQLSFSAYSMIQDDVTRIKSNLLKTIEAVSFIAFPLFWGMASVGAEALPLILGPHWMQATIPFIFLCIITPFLSISPIYPSVLNAIGKPRVVFLNSLIEALILVLAIFIGVRFGLRGICIAWLCFYPIAFLIISQRSLSAIDLGMNHLYARLRFPVFASLGMSSLVLLIKKMLAGSVNPISILLVSIVIGSATYGLLSIVYKKDEIMKLRRIFSTGSRGS